MPARVRGGLVERVRLEWSGGRTRVQDENFRRSSRYLLTFSGEYGKLVSA